MSKKKYILDDFRYYYEEMMRQYSRTLIAFCHVELFCTTHYVINISILVTDMWYNSSTGNQTHLEFSPRPSGFSRILIVLCYLELCCSTFWRFCRKDLAMHLDTSSVLYPGFIRCFGSCNRQPRPGDPRGIDYVPVRCSSLKPDWNSDKMKLIHLIFQFIQALW